MSTGPRKDFHAKISESCVLVLMAAHGNLCHTLEQKHPDDTFMLDVITNYISGHGLGAIRIHVYVAHHNWA